MNITMDGKYRTREGREWRTLCVDAPGPRPVVGYWVDDNGFAIVGVRDAHGKVFPGLDDDHDLVPALASGTDWIVRSWGDGVLAAYCGFGAKDDAEARASGLRDAGYSVAGPYRVDWTEGESS